MPEDQTGGQTNQQEQGATTQDKDQAIRERMAALHGRVEGGQPPPPVEEPPDTEAQQAAPPAENATQQETDGFQPSDAQRAMCRQVGLTDEQVAGLSEVQTQAYVQAAKMMSEKYGRLGREKKLLSDELERLRPLVPAGNGQTTATAGQPSTMAAPPDSVFSAETFGEEHSIHALNAMQNELRTLNARIEAMDAARLTREAASLESEANAMFSGLDGEIFHQFFAGEDAHANRERVLSVALTTRSAYEEQAGEDMPFKTALNAALAALHPEEIEAQRVKALHGQIAKRQGQFAPRPSGRTMHREQPPTTNDERDAAIKQKMVERGYPVS